jgi:hypothetical protein
VRIALVVLMSLISFSTFARETVVVAFANGDVEFSAKISNDNEEAGFHIKKLVIRIPGASHGKLRLVSEFGWDDKPYNFICEKFSRALYGDDRFKFSTAYGYATATGGLGNLFTREEFFIFNRDQTFEVSDSYPNAVYDSELSCYEREFLY